MVTHNLAIVFTVVLLYNRQRKNPRPQKRTRAQDRGHIVLLRNVYALHDWKTKHKPQEWILEKVFIVFPNAAVAIIRFVY